MSETVPPTDIDVDQVEPVEPVDNPDELLEPGGETPADEEAHDGDEPETPADDLEPPDEQEARSSNAVIRQLEGEHTRRAKNLAKILGADFDNFVECPTCAAMGYVHAPAPKQDTRVQRCDHCNGLGQVLTGAVAPGEAIRQCPACLGNGHVPTQPVEAPQFTGPPPTAPTNGTVAVTPAPAPPIDPRVAALAAEGFVVIPPYSEPVAS